MTCGKHQTCDTLSMTQNTLFVNHMTQYSILRHLWLKESYPTRLENMILSQLRIGELQAICEGLAVEAM